MEMVHPANSAIGVIFEFLGSVVNSTVWFFGLIGSAIDWYLYICSPKLHLLFSLTAWVVRSISGLFNSTALLAASIASEFPASTVLLAATTVALYCVLWPRAVRYRPVPRAGYRGDGHLHPEYLRGWRGENTESILTGIAARGI